MSDARQIFTTALRALRATGTRTPGRGAKSLRPLTRAALLTATLALLAPLIGAQAASAALVSSVSPREACAGTTVTFTGTLFGPVGTSAPVLWSDPASQGNPTLISTTAKTTSNTTATAVVPLFLSTETGSGTSRSQEASPSPSPTPP